MKTHDWICKRIIVIPLLLAVLFLSSCVRPPVTIQKPEEAMERASSWWGPKLWDDQEFKDIAVAARQSLEYYKKLPPDALFYFGPEKATALDMVLTLQNFLLIIENGGLTTAQKLERIKQDFVLYHSVGSNGKGRVLYTGYYEPLLSCRVFADETFRFPLYRKPDDIIEIDLTQFGNGFPRNRLFGRLDGKKVIPYYSREEIDQKKVLSGKDLEILWCSDIVDIYVLQVQGSGKVDLGDGNIISVLYDGANGRPYKSIGKYLIDTGAMTKEAMSMQATREYLRSHPDKMNEVLNQNQSYVFFRLDMGPSLGNIGVPLTPGRSIATDSRLFPKGALGYVVAQKPVIENGAIKAWVPFTRFVLNQDTGGAIKGAGRVDMFFGRGLEAELTAGNFQHEGELYFLMRKKEGAKR
jgi:membrane-bound lytic murein transglycosylase A